MISAASRYRPGTDSQKIAFAGTPGAFTAIRTKTAHEANSEKWVSIYVDADVHVVFGSEQSLSGVTPAITHFLLTPEQGIQDFLLRADDTGLKAIGASGSGNIYLCFSS